MVTLEELKKISDMSALERTFYLKLEEAKHIALSTNKRSFELKVMKASFFSNELAKIVKTPLNADELYKSQFDQIQMFKDAGFTVTEEDPAPAIIMPGASTQDAMQQEFDSKYLEKKVTVAW